MPAIKHRNGGFTLVEIMIVVAIIGLLAAIAIPNFVKARTLSQRNACIANLKQIDGAKHEWALETKKSATDSPTKTDLYGTDKYIRDEPYCPGGGTYNINTVIVKPTCTITDHTI
jgi:general secretion pathway protein G